jgi:hypothetical protein
MIYLLHANVWVTLLRGKSAQVEARFRAAVAGELEALGQAQ